MRSCVPLQIEGVVESLAAECTEVALGVTVTLHVPVQQPLQSEPFAANSAGELVGVRLRPDGGQLLDPVRGVRHHRVLDPVATVDQLQRRVFRDSVPLLQNLNSHLQ